MQIRKVFVARRSGLYRHRSSEQIWIKPGYLNNKGDLRVFKNEAFIQTEINVLQV